MGFVELDQIFEGMDLGVFRRLEIFVEVVLEIGHYFVNYDHPARGGLTHDDSLTVLPIKHETIRRRRKRNIADILLGQSLHFVVRSLDLGVLQSQQAHAVSGLLTICFVALSTGFR